MKSLPLNNISTRLVMVFNSGLFKKSLDLLVYRDSQNLGQPNSKSKQ